MEVGPSTGIDDIRGGRLLESRRKGLSEGRGWGVTTGEVLPVTGNTIVDRVGVGTLPLLQIKGGTRTGGGRSSDSFLGLKILKSPGDL